MLKVQCELVSPLSLRRLCGDRQEKLRVKAVCTLDEVSGEVDSWLMWSVVGVVIGLFHLLGSGFGVGVDRIVRLAVCGWCV